MAERYSVVIPPDETLKKFSTAREIVEYLSNDFDKNKNGRDAIITDLRYSELNISIKCNIQTGVVEAMPNVMSNIQESYPFLTKPIEAAISHFALEKLRERLSNDKDPAISNQVKESILKQLPSAPAPLVSSFVNFSVFAPSMDPKKLLLGGRSFDLKTLSLNDVDAIVLAAKSTAPASNLSMNK